MPNAVIPSEAAIVAVEPAVSSVGSVLPRHIAGILDNLVAIVISILAAKSVSDDQPMVQVLALVTAYFAYFLGFEGLISRTPGKLLTGIVVLQFDGSRCTWRQTLIRTVMRVLEVNPLLFGAIPAALSILMSRNHQRFGDKLAGTIVVQSWRIRRQR